MSDTTTPTKNESLPELPVRELPEKWRGIAGTRCAEDKLDAAIEYSMNETLRMCADELEAALTREAPTEGVWGDPVFAGYDPGQDDREAEDYHVIMTMGRLLAAIAISVKGPEPAGTAWSYHDLPDIVAALQEAAEQVADEMTAWAATKMADRGSSRRDRLMISEWAKRLRNPESFPVKDFEVEGTTLTKEEMRAIVRKVIATPPAPQRQSSNPSGLSSESAPLSSEQRLAQGEDRPSWLRDGALIAGWEAKAAAYESDALEADSIGLQIRADRNEARAEVLRECANELRTRIEYATQPPHQDRGEVAEPGAIRALVTAANAVLALHPEDDGMWTLELAVRPFNAKKPAECMNGCPANTVCDYCQTAALTEAKQQSDLPFATVQQVVRALFRLGYAAPEGQEEQAARANELVLTLCREVMEAKQQDDEDEAPTPTALDIRYAEGFADGIKHEERRAEVAKQQGPEEAVAVAYRSGHERWCSSKEGAGCSCGYTPEKKEYTHSDAPQVEAKRQTGEGFVLVPVEPTDYMVDAYAEAVNAHLGSLTPKDWEIERFNPAESIRRVARIGIRAMIAAAAKPSGEVES